jgi:hypothetical protein
VCKQEETGEKKNFKDGCHDDRRYNELSTRAISRILIISYRDHESLSWSADSLFNELPNGRGRHCAGLPGNFAAIFENYKGGDRADSISLSRSRQLFGIDFDDNPSPGFLARQPGNFRRDHFARPTPGCPKVCYYWQRGPSGKSMENILLLQLDRLARSRQLRMALPTTERLTEPFVIHTVTLTTLRTA